MLNCVIRNVILYYESVIIRIVFLFFGVVIMIGEFFFFVSFVGMFVIGFKVIGGSFVIFGSDFMLWYKSS